MTEIIVTGCVGCPMFVDATDPLMCNHPKHPMKYRHTAFYLHQDCPLKTKSIKIKLAENE